MSNIAEHNAINGSSTLLKNNFLESNLKDVEEPFIALCSAMFMLCLCYIYVMFMFMSCLCYVYCNCYIIYIYI